MDRGEQVRFRNQDYERIFMDSDGTKPPGRKCCVYVQCAGIKHMILSYQISNLGLVRFSSFLPGMIPGKLGLYKLYKRSRQERFHEVIPCVPNVA